MNRHDQIDRLRRAFPGQDTTGFNALDLIHKFGQPLMALLYSELFWPEFREIDGMVFLADAVEDDEDETRAKVALERMSDRIGVEKSFNLVEIPLLFGRSAGESTEEENEILAEKIREMWVARLRQCFPGRRFEVQVIPSTEEAEIAVLFFEKRLASSER